MASKRRLSKEEQNFIRFVKTCTDIIKLPLKDILASEIQPIDLYTKIQSSCLLTDRRSRLGSDQLKICYIPPPSTPDYDKFDVTLLYKLIRNLCPSLKPTQGWDVDPLNSDILIGDDIERLRLFRNNCVHGSSTKILDSDFEDRWKRLKCVILRIQTYMTLKGGNPNYEGELTVMRQLDLGDETLEEFKKTYIVEHTYDRLKNNIDKPFITISGTEKVFCGEIARFKVIVSPKDLGGWSVKWQKLNGDVSTHIDLNKEKYSRPTDRELIIHSVCREDEGIYQAYLSQESNGSNFKVLGNALCLQTVGELPVFDLWKVTKGKEGINIHYKVKENKPFVTKIRWTKDGDPLDYGSKKYIGGDLKDGYITITSPITEDRGTYTCMVTNAVGTVHKDVTIDCPSVQISSTELVYFGCKTEISPNISSCPSVDEIEWQKSSDGNTFNSVDIGEPKYYGSSRDPESALLVLPKVKFEDKLYYRLFAWNKIGEQYSNIIYLNVTGSPPNIVVNHRTYIENNSVELIASVFSSEKLLVVQKVVWTKDGKEVDIDGSGGKYSKVNAQNPSLTIFDVNKHDAGSYQLTATNIVGSTKSDDIILGVPDVFLERHVNKENESQYFMAAIESIPTPYNVQWCTKSKDDGRLKPIDVNDEEYIGSTNCLPRPVLVLKQKDQLEKICFKIKVTNFIGSNVFDVIPGENHSVVNEKEVDLGNKHYRDSEAGIRFAKLCNYLTRQFPPEEFENLKHVLRSSEKVTNVSSLMDANSVWTCLTILQDEQLFTKKDVTFMQWLCTETGCEALNAKCIDYARKQGAIFFSEKQPENGYMNIPFHVQGDLNGYTKEDIQHIVKTVAAMLDCEEKDIFVCGVLHSTSFILILSIKESFSQKLSALNEQERFKLRMLNVDSLSLNGKTITLESANEFQDKYSQINERMNSKDDDQKQNTNFDESFSTDTECSLEIHVEDIKIKAGNISEDDDQEQITKTEESYSTETGCSLDRSSKIHANSVIWTKTPIYVDDVTHISCSTAGKIWVNNGKTIKEIDEKGHVLRIIKVSSLPFGCHSETKDGNLLFIQDDYIKLLTRNGEIRNILRKYCHCIYSSKINCDILIGIYEGVIRLSKSGEILQKFIKDDKGQKLYDSAIFITENKNGDIIVSDLGKSAVVVVDKTGHHRFNYSSIHFQLAFYPRGICTDVVGNILVCNMSYQNPGVHLLDQDGHVLALFSTHLMSNPPCAMCMDDRHNLVLGYAKGIYIHTYLPENLLKDHERIAKNKQCVDKTVE